MRPEGQALGSSRAGQFQAGEVSGVGQSAEQEPGEVPASLGPSAWPAGLLAPK